MAGRIVCFLGVELAEVVVDVFVDDDGPLVGGEGAEEGVGVGGAGCGAGGGELGEERGEAGLFGGEVGVVMDDDFVEGRGVAGQGRVLVGGI
jgi:hypothetical protein